jgi:outer membrane protein OmpA-like peptidoglycan-associated protein
VNPFARKKWVRRQTDPINDRLTELDEVNAKNAHDIQDVDARAQAGIRNAQTTADAAGQAATAAASQAQQAGLAAQGAAGHLERLNATVGGLDSYRQASEIEVSFRSGQTLLAAPARRQLDELAASLAGRQGYLLEIEGHSPTSGGAGLQNSARLAEAVKRYLVTKHEIPVYRMHAVALGNALAAGAEEARPTKAGVHLRLMENTLAAQEVASPHDAASMTGTERP